MNEPHIVSLADLPLDPFVVAGFSIRTTNDQAAQTIPLLWKRVLGADLAQTVPNATALAVTGGEVPLVAIYDAYETDHTGPYTLTVGVPVKRAEGLDPSLTVRRVEGRRYAHLEAHGEGPAAVWAAWQWVWRELTPRRAFTQDLEIYSPSRAASGPIDIFIAVRDA